MTKAIDKPPAWVRDAVFYQIFPDRFAKSAALEKPQGLEPWADPPTFNGYKGGDLLGICESLDWLTDLGINAIYLNPIFQSGANHRYHTHDYLLVDPLLGGNEAFDTLLSRCHQRGIRVMLDGVFNHASRGFFYFHDVLENGPSSPWADWFVIHDWPLHPYDADKPANYEAWWGLKALPKFNTDNPQVREYLMRVGEYWAYKGIDGWRLDVPEEIQTPGFWEEFRERVKAINPDLYIVGEIWGDATSSVSDGTKFDATMNYQFTTAAIAFAAGQHVDRGQAVDNPWYDISPIDAAGYGDRIDRLLATYPEEVNLANLNLLDSHDTARILTIAHDDADSVALAALLLLTFPGAPSIYYGTEVGLPGGKDPDCRRAFPWDDEASWDKGLLETFQSLIALRHAHPALRSSGYRRMWPHPGTEGSLLYLAERTAEGETLIVGVNASENREAVSIQHEDLPGTELELLWGRAALTQGENHVRISMPPRRGAIWKAA